MNHRYLEPLKEQSNLRLKSISAIMKAYDQRENCPAQNQSFENKVEKDDKVMIQKTLGLLHRSQTTDQSSRSRDVTQ